MSEIEFIEAVKARQKPMLSGVGIGDDAAIIPSDGSYWVVATDMIMDGRHFDINCHHLEDIGRKALAVNLSDMAAMGATPRYVLVSLAVAAGFGTERLTKIWSGLQRLADEYDVRIIGGDTNAWSGSLVLNVTVLGSPPPFGCVLRSGARAGDDIYVTGSLGGSMTNDHHLRFEPKVREAQQILATSRPTAMIDVSDGIATDLHHLCTASGVGADIKAIQIPVSPRVDFSLSPEARLAHALSDGEDFELLFTVPPATSSLLATLPFEVFKIGEMSPHLGLRLDGKPVVVHGFEHAF